VSDSFAYFILTKNEKKKLPLFNLDCFFVVFLFCCFVVLVFKVDSSETFNKKFMIAASIGKAQHRFSP